MPITKKQLIQMLIDSDIPDDAVVVKKLRGDRRTCIGHFNSYLVNSQITDCKPLDDALFTNPSECNAFQII